VIYEPSTKIWMKLKNQSPKQYEFDFSEKPKSIWENTPVTYNYTSSTSGTYKVSEVNFFCV
jgi:hypothetical protein